MFRSTDGAVANRLLEPSYFLSAAVKLDSTAWNRGVWCLISDRSPLPPPASSQDTSDPVTGTQQDSSQVLACIVISIKYISPSPILSDINNKNYYDTTSQSSHMHSADNKPVGQYEPDGGVCCLHIIILSGLIAITLKYFFTLTNSANFVSSLFTLNCLQTEDI